MMMIPLLALTLAAAPVTPLAVVKSGNEAVQKIVGSGEGSVEKLATRADDFIDFVELAKRALGEQWSKLDKKKQDDFAQTMKGVLRASYAQRAISDGKSGAKFEWGEEKIEGNEATVKSTLVAGKDKFPVDYKLFRADAKAAWKIYDVITDQVSLVTTYNDQFRQLMAKKGFDGLLTTLKAKKAQLEKPVEPAQAAGAK